MPDTMQQLLARFEPISLADANATASLQTRVDTKYMVPWDTFADWSGTLADTHRILEIEGTRLFTYDTQYFDTPSLGFFRDHLQGRRQRFKIRTREYVESGIAFLEIKLKGGRGETIKRRIPHRLDQLDSIPESGLEFLDGCLGEMYEVDLDQPLQPTVQTVYRRSTFVAMDGTERITCDTDLNFVHDGSRRASMRPSLVLVEIKSPRGRSPSDRALWRRGVRPGKGSKYCIGVSLTMARQRSNLFLREIRAFYRKADHRTHRHRATPDVAPLPGSHHAGLAGQYD